MKARRHAGPRFDLAMISGHLRSQRRLPGIHEPIRSNAEQHSQARPHDRLSPERGETELPKRRCGKAFGHFVGSVRLEPKRPPVRCGCKPVTAKPAPVGSVRKCAEKAHGSVSRPITKRPRNSGTSVDFLGTQIKAFQIRTLMHARTPFRHLGP